MLTAQAWLLGTKELEEKVCCPWNLLHIGLSIIK